MVLVICSSGTCFAEVDENGFEHLSNGHILYNDKEYEPIDQNQFAKEIFAIYSKVPVFGKPALSLVESCMIFDGSGVRGNDGTFYIATDRKTESGDDIVFSDAYVDSVYNSALDQIKDSDGYIFVPTTSFKFSNSYFQTSYAPIYNANFHQFTILMIMIFFGNTHHQVSVKLLFLLNLIDIFLFLKDIIIILLLLLLKIMELMPI